MIAKIHPLFFAKRNVDYGEFDAYMRSMGFSGYHGISTTPKMDIGVVLTSDHQDDDYSLIMMETETYLTTWDELEEIRKELEKKPPEEPAKEVDNSPTI